MTPCQNNPGYRTLRVAGSVTFRHRRRGDRAQRGAGPFGGLASVVSGEAWGAPGGLRTLHALFCFCERILRTRALQPARSPDRWWPKPGRWTPGPIDAHVNPIGGGLGRLPTMPPIGFSCAWKGSCCQRRGLAASMATTTDTLVPKTQTTSPITLRFQRFSSRWSALWAPQHLKP